VSLVGREYWGPSDELEKRIINWGEGASYVVDVRIVSNMQGRTRGVTFAHKKFTLERKGIAYSAKMMETT
jgi:hypothetical protein